MVRVRVQFPKAQHRQLKRWAQERSISMAEAVRQCVAEQLLVERIGPSRAKLVRAALSVVGEYADSKGARDVGRNHDAYLADAYGQ